MNRVTLKFICLQVFITCSLLTAGGDDDFRLEPMNDVVMKAGMDNFDRYYSVSKIKGGWGAIHRDGHKMEVSELTDYFQNTIFQFYTKISIGLDPNYNYQQLPSIRDRLGAYEKGLILDICGHLGVTFNYSDKDFKDFEFNVSLLELGVGNFKNNLTLNRLGSAYFRQKIVVEKLGRVLATIKNDPDKSAQVQAVLLAHDRLAIDLQTVIYHFMREGYAQFLRNLKNGEGFEAGMVLETCRPTFLDKPYYKKIMDDLRDHYKPTEQVEGIPLPAA